MGRRNCLCRFEQHLGRALHGGSRRNFGRRRSEVPDASACAWLFFAPASPVACVRSPPSCFSPFRPSCRGSAGPAICHSSLIRSPHGSKLLPLGWPKHIKASLAHGGASNRVNHYQFPPLDDCRAHFEKLAGLRRKPRSLPVRELKGIIARPRKPVSVADMRKAVARRAGR